MSLIGAQRVDPLLPAGRVDDGEPVELEDAGDRKDVAQVVVDHQHSSAVQPGVRAGLRGRRGCGRITAATPLTVPSPSSSAGAPGWWPAVAVPMPFMPGPFAAVPFVAVPFAGVPFAAVPFAGVPFAVDVPLSPGGGGRQTQAGQLAPAW